MRAILFIAGRHLWNRKLLNGIAVVGVTFGVLTLVAITGIMRGFQTKFLDTIVKITPHVVITDTELGTTETAIERVIGRPAAVRLAHAASSDRETRIIRPTEMVAAIERIEGVVAAAPVVVGSAVASSRGRELPVELRGIDPVRQDRVTPLRPLVVEGSLAQLGGGLDGAMIGFQLADLLGVELGDTITCASARGERATLRIVALFETRIASLDRGRIYVSQRLAQTILGRGDTIDRIEVRLDDAARAPSVVVALERRYGYDAESWQELNASMLGVFDQQNMITGFIIAAVLLVGGFGILAIQIMVAMEKRRDIALLKSVGYRSRDVLAIFLVQGAAVSLIGGLLGGGIGHLLLTAMRGLKSASGMGYSRPDNFAIYERPSVYLLAIGFALLVGVAAGLLPAWRASRVEPVDVLRGAS